VPHEYRLVLGADHLGRTIGPRVRECLRFLDVQVLRPPPPDTSYAAQKATIDALRRRMGVPDDQPRPPFPATGGPR
jgi:hypothetical protein